MLVLEGRDELEISGEKRDLLALAAICFSGRDGQLPLKVSSDGATDSSVSISLGSGPIEIRLESSNVLIRGEQSKLSLLGENIAFLANQKTSRERLKPHLHIEYVPGHAYLEEASEPLVLTLLPTD